MVLTPNCAQTDDRAEDHQFVHQGCPTRGWRTLLQKRPARKSAEQKSVISSTDAKSAPAILQRESEPVRCSGTWMPTHDVVSAHCCARAPVCCVPPTAPPTGPPGPVGTANARPPAPTGLFAVCSRPRRVGSSIPRRTPRHGGRLTKPRLNGESMNQLGQLTGGGTEKFPLDR